MSCVYNLLNVEWSLHYFSALIPQKSAAFIIVVLTVKEETMNGLQRTHLRIVVVLAVLGISILAQGSLLAFADPPRTNTLQINDTNTVTGVCAFPLTEHDQGALRTSLFFDRNGQVNRVTENWQDVQSTLTNPANGRSLSYRMAGHDGFTVGRDGSFTIVTQGVRGIITVPGSGAISGEAGNITITLAPDGTVDVQRSGFLRDGDFTIACNYLQATP
jgi:hypothetical protein